MQEYKAGQIWGYKTRAGEEDSFVQIVKIDEIKGITSYQIYFYKIKLKTDLDQIQTELHVPVSKEALDKSVTSLTQQDMFDHPHMDGYEEWREGFENGKAGVWSIELQEILSAVEHAMKNHS